MFAFALVGVAVVAVVLGLRMAGPRPSEEPAPEPPAPKESPFDFLGLPEGFAPRPSPQTSEGRGDGRRATPGDPPAVLAADPDWQAALTAVSLGRRLAEEAGLAQQRGETAQMRDLARDAAVKFEQALEVTEPWLERLDASLGSSDRGVQNFRRHREQWREDLAVLRRIT